jgi:tetratricopeptide (TPR) repeat protein
MPTNNLFFLNGATLAERFIFVPSFAFALAITLLLCNGLKIKTTAFSGEKKQVFKIVMIGVIVLFSGLSMAKSGDWKNNFTLFESGAKNAPNSSRTNAAFASEYMNKAQEESDPALKNELILNSIEYYKKSLSIFPGNSDASYKVGLIYSMIGKPEESIKYYRQSLEATPGQIYALNNLGSLYASRQQYDSAKFFFTRSFEADSSNELTLTNLEVVNFLLNDYDKAIDYGNRALALNYQSAKIYNLLTQAWMAKGNVAMANKFSDLEKLLLPKR